MLCQDAALTYEESLRDGNMLVGFQTWENRCGGGGKGDVQFRGFSSGSGAARPSVFLQVQQGGVTAAPGSLQKSERLPVCLS